MRQPDTVVAATVLTIFAAMVAVAATYPPEVRLVPLVVGIPALLLSGWQLSREMGRRPAAAAGRRPAGAEARALLWVALFTLIVLAGGFVVGGTLAVVVGQRLWLRESWRTAAIGGGIALFVAEVCFQRLLGLVLFGGWLAPWVLG